MASAVPATPDTMVTLKVNFEGSTRRFKLPLRDMGANTLEAKVRSFLGIPHDAMYMIERFSDSAAAYVVLDPSNVSVYKQLFRAAKAKQKLKLRVTKLQPEPEPETEVEAKQVPKPVTVEDVPEAQAAPAVPAGRVPEPMSTTEANNDPVVDPIAEALEHLRVAGIPDARHGMENSLSPEEARLRYHNSRNRLSQLLSEVSAAHGLNARDKWFADAARSESPAGSSTESNPATLCPAAGANFAVCCNSCDKTIPDSHYHCSTCDDGDFDLCQTCVDQGITCYGSDHWLIKRVVKNGQILNSTTETIAPKPKVVDLVEQAISADQDIIAAAAAALYGARMNPMSSRASVYNTLTCNCCVEELPEHHFLHCTSCEDFDLCKTCFAKDNHGHHPKHGFVPAVEGANMPDHIKSKLSPGRNQIHNAICDGCDKFITGVRHKCLDCPDWDYCAGCVVNANFVHPNHRFVPVYEPLAEPGARVASRAVHFGICCDGPLCSASRSALPPYITGIRYKCAVCHDTDFCANCEASPANTHNKTHPLLKFKTPVRHCSVTTMGEHENGKKLPTMGDREVPARTRSRSTETAAVTIAETSVQTVVDVKPSEPAPVEEEKAEKVVVEEVKEEVPEVKVEKTAAPALNPEDLGAVYVHDTVIDGTELPPNHVFEQTWVLRNAGTVAWPAGCSVKFVGGDYMGHVDSSHPAGISELVSASESTVCYEPLEPGMEFPFTVLLRTPAREGKIISYWRLTTKDGFKFGHRLWCDVNVQNHAAAATPIVAEEAEVPSPVVEEKAEAEPQPQTSQMIFPKLEKESPVSSIHQEAVAATEPAKAAEEADDFEDCEDDEWDNSEDGFMTDDEYDILDASDEEFLVQQQKPLKK